MGIGVGDSVGGGVGVGVGLGVGVGASVGVGRGIVGSGVGAVVGVAVAHATPITSNSANRPGIWKTLRVIQQNPEGDSGSTASNFFTGESSISYSRKWVRLSAWE